jgi:hypothetical protein
MYGREISLLTDYVTSPNWTDNLCFDGCQFAVYPYSRIKDIYLWSHVALIREIHSFPLMTEYELIPHSTWVR